MTLSAIDGYATEGGCRRAALLDAYSDACLRRVWRAEHFSWWMTSMLHRPPDADPFDLQLQRAQLGYVVRSEAAAGTASAAPPMRMALKAAMMVTARK